MEVRRMRLVPLGSIRLFCMSFRRTVEKRTKRNKHGTNSRKGSRERIISAMRELSARPSVTFQYGPSVTAAKGCLTHAWKES